VPIPPVPPGPYWPGTRIKKTFGRQVAVGVVGLVALITLGAWGGTVALSSLRPASGESMTALPTSDVPPPSDFTEGFGAIDSLPSVSPSVMTPAPSHAASPLRPSANASRRKASPSPSTRDREESDRTESGRPSRRTCAEALADGDGPYRKGRDVEYAWYDDHDMDGWACEGADRDDDNRPKPEPDTSPLP